MYVGGHVQELVYFDTIELNNDMQNCMWNSLEWHVKKCHENRQSVLTFIHNELCDLHVATSIGNK